MTDRRVVTSALGVRRVKFGPISVDLNPDGSYSIGNGVCLWGNVQIARETANALLTAAAWIEQEQVIKVINLPRAKENQPNE